MSKTISRLYNNQLDARAAVKELEAAGVSHGDISILVSNADGSYDEKTKTFPDRDLDGTDDRAEGAAAGGSVGAVAGGTVGLLTGLGLMAIPGVGPVVAAGWLVATLTGAAAGGATGGIIGALSQQAGISSEEADVYAEGLRRGGALVSAKVDDADAVRYQGIMDRSAVRIEDRAIAYRKTGWTKYDEAAAPYNREQVIKERTLY
ncbi:MAG: hypothetical protein Q7T81_11145 [Pseudolabrys sp.]|nr:hypothetical protein [Pseudolabrys sp.]